MSSALEEDWADVSEQDGLQRPGSDRLEETKKQCDVLEREEAVVMKEEHVMKEECLEI